MNRLSGIGRTKSRAMGVRKCSVSGCSPEEERLGRGSLSGGRGAPGL